MVPRRGALAVGGLILASQSNTLGFLFVCIVVLPLGIGFGILKYRLYDIDRLISRTLSYAILTALLVGVFVGLVLLTTRVLPFSSPGRRRGLDARRGRAVQSAAPPRAAARRPPLQPRPLRRRGDRRGLRAPASATRSTSTRSSTNSRRAAARSLEPAHVTVWVRAAP